MQVPGAVVVLDDRLRRLHAEALRLTFTGTLGILLREKWKGGFPGSIPYSNISAA
jgi:predicted nucleic acid-binding protein